MSVACSQVKRSVSASVAGHEVGVSAHQHLYHLLCKSLGEFRTGNNQTPIIIENGKAKIKCLIGRAAVTNSAWAQLWVQSEWKNNIRSVLNHLFCSASPCIKRPVNHLECTSSCF